MRETFVVLESVARSMRANRATDTRPELALRRALWGAGYRGYRKNRRGLPGTPDVAYGRRKIAIFVHGCYWHGCPFCEPRRAPKTNAAFWADKWRRNAERDGRTRRELEAMGWTVEIVQECELKPKRIGETMARLAFVLTTGGGGVS